MRQDPRFDSQDQGGYPPYTGSTPDLPPRFGDRPSRLRLLWRRQKRLIRPLVVLLGIAALLAIAGRILWDAASEQRYAPLREKLVAMEPLQIHHIIINGRNLTTEDEIERALGTDIGHPIFAFSVEAARQRIDALPFVDHAAVERHMPDTVIVTIVERTPIAVWQDRGHFSLINKAGEEVPDQGLTGKNAEAFLRLPLVVGTGANVAAASMIDALKAQPRVRAQVTALVRVGGRRWDIILRDGTTIFLPEGAETAALARLVRYEDSLHLLERPVPSIDMRLPDRMVIHQAPLPSSSPPPSSPSAMPPRTQP